MTSNPSRFLDYEQFRQHLLMVEYQLGYDGKSTGVWIFSDESGTHSGSRYFGIGGLFIYHTSVSGKKFGLDLLEICKAKKWTDEFKWKDLSSRNVHRYREFAETFFTRPKTVRFHCIIVDRTLLTKGDSKSLETIFKFYYLLLTYRINPMATVRPIQRSILIPDEMSLPDEYWAKLFHSINASLKRHYDIERYPVVKCFPTKSKFCQEIQLTDVLLGSVVAWYNRDFESQSKKEFSENLVNRIKLCDKFKVSIWEWQSTEKKK